MRGGGGARLHVLVAEDNRTNQKVIGKILEHAGHRATIVATGQEAVEALEEPGFDLVLMDLNMPELGGIEAVKLLRFTHDLDELPPIVALSADATPQTREACRTVGFSAYLTKPVDTQLLLRTPGELTGGTRRHPAVDRSRAHGRIARRGRAEAGRAVDPARLASLAELDSGDGFLDGLIDDFLADLAGHARPASSRRRWRRRARCSATRRMPCAAVPPMSGRSACSTCASAGASSTTMP